MVRNQTILQYLSKRDIKPVPHATVGRREGALPNDRARGGGRIPLSSAGDLSGFDDKVMALRYSGG